jgi:CubicO group peptidase (beta-lactamase class C family)
MNPTLRLFLALLILALLAGCAGLNPAAPAVETAPFEWTTSTPEEQGMESAALAKAIEIGKQPDLNLHSLLVIRNGVIVSETYYGSFKQDTPHELYSVTKSFTSTLIGIALDQGKLDGIDRPVLEYFPKLGVEAVDAEKSAMTVEHLLTMTSGLDWIEGDPVYRAMYMSRDWTKYVLDVPMRAPPGTEFNYCSGCTHVLSAILSQSIGMDEREFADRYLFGPLGIDDYQWDTSSEGNLIGGWGLFLTPRDMARLGYLFLQEGKWQWQQIVSADWVRQATEKHVETGGDWDYGYQWWVEPDLGAYTASGRYGQHIYVHPASNLVVVTTAAADDGGPILKMIKEVILPAVVEEEGQ